MGRGEISHCLGAKAAAIRFANDQENAPETRVRQSNLAISGMTPRVRTFTTRSRELVSLASSLVFHVSALVTIDWLAARSMWPVNPSAETQKSIAVVVVPVPDTSSVPGLNPIDRSDDGAMISPHLESPNVDVPGFRINIARIRDRSMMLFPFLTPGLALERFGLHPQRGPTAATPKWQSPARVSDPPKPAAPPLAVSGAEIQSLIDEAWSRRDRWDVFHRIVALTNGFSADAGQLPEVLHKYVEGNALQPYVDTTIRDPRLWTELGIAADHVIFIAFISRYATEHPSTRASTELLFLLDKLAEGSLDALLTLVQSDPTEQLRWTRAANRGAYGLVLDLRRFYAAHLARRGLASPDRITRYYENVRLAILEAIVRSTPDAYRADDARFLIGAIHWRRGDRTEALTWWRDMTDGDPTDSYAAWRARLLQIIRAPEGVDARQVDTVLHGVHGAWLMFSIDRIRHFGYRLDTY